MSNLSLKTNLERLVDLRCRLSKIESVAGRKREIQISLRCFPDLFDYLVLYVQHTGQQTLTSDIALKKKRLVQNIMPDVPVRGLLELIWNMRAGLLYGEPALFWWVAFVLRQPPHHRKTVNSILDQDFGYLPKNELKSVLLTSTRGMNCRSLRLC